jgi:hypothetical protein
LTFDLGFAFDLAAAFLGLTSSSASSSLSTFAFEVDVLPFFGLTSASASPLAALLFFAAFLGLGSSSSSFSSTSGFLAESGTSSSSTDRQLSSTNKPTFSFLESDFDLTSARLTIDSQSGLLSLAYPHFFVSCALHMRRILTQFPRLNHQSVWADYIKRLTSINIRSLVEIGMQVLDDLGSYT